MRRLLQIVAIAAMSMALAPTLVCAQNIRLGERIPTIDVHSTMGTELNYIDKEYVCLIFIHSGSLPCVDALDSFEALADSVEERMAVVLITPEQRSSEQDIVARFIDNNTTVAFDKEHKTFKSFGINFVPFGVIYDTKQRRTRWFGSIQQLDESTIRAIVRN